MSALVENQDIRYNQQVISIDVENRLLRTSKGDEYQFDRLISSLPLPEVIKMLKNVPVDVCNAVARLHCTCGYQISVGLKTKNILLIFGGTFMMRIFFLLASTHLP